MKPSSSPTLRTFAICVLLAIAAAAASAAVHWTFGYADPFTTTPHIFAILVAHYLFVVEVRKAKARKTAAGKWAGLGFFGIYLGVVIAAYGAGFAQIGLADGAYKADASHRLATGLYFSVVTWTTVGYGDVTATQPVARFFAAMEALNGYVVLALFIAALVPVFQDLLQEERGGSAEG